LAAIVESLSQFFGATAEAPAVQRHLSEYMRAAADRVLAAEDREHLLALVDDLSADGVFWSDLSQAAERSAEQSSVAPDITKVKLDMRSLVAVLGNTAAMKCEKGHHAIIALAEEWPKFKATMGVNIDEESNSPAAKSSFVSMSDLVYDREIPLLIRQFIAKIMLSIASVIVIANAEERANKLDPWLGLALAEVFATPFEDALAAVTNQSALQSLHAYVVRDVKDQAKFEAVSARWRDEAAVSGENVYFPFDHAAG
jgi:hypothetical protein